MDHRAQADQCLAFKESQDALTHAILALVDRLDEISCLVALPQAE